MNDSDGSSKKIKVVDRRRFTEDGSPREPAAEEVSPQPAPDDGGPDSTTPAPDIAAPSRPEPTEIPGSQTRPPGSAVETSREFVELVAMLAQQAELLLAGTDEIPAQPEQSKRLIDYLGALEAKTQGNLSDEERQLLSSVVFELRTLFVQARR